MAAWYKDKMNIISYLKKYKRHNILHDFPLETLSRLR